MPLLDSPYGRLIRRMGANQVLPNLAIEKAIFRDTLLFPNLLEVTLCPALLTTYLPNACFHMEFIVFFQSRYNFDCNFSFLGLFLEFFGWRSTAWSNYGHFKNKRIEKLQRTNRKVQPLGSSAAISVTAVPKREGGNS